MTCLAYTQFWSAVWGFKVDKRQKVSMPVLGIIVGSLLGIGVVCIIVALRSEWAWIDAVGLSIKGTSLSLTKL